DTLCLVEQILRAVQVALDLPDPGHRYSPAMRKLGESSRLSQFRASQEVLRGGIQVVPFTMNLAHARIEIRRAPQDSRAVLSRTLQRALVRAHCLVEATLRNPDIRQGRDTADGISDVSGLLQARHALGIGLVRRLQL